MNTSGTTWQNPSVMSAPFGGVSEFIKQKIYIKFFLFRSVFNQVICGNNHHHHYHQ
jgi:hypothetical protein